MRYTGGIGTAAQVDLIMRLLIILCTTTLVALVILIATRVVIAPPRSVATSPPRPSLPTLLVVAPTREPQSTPALALSPAAVVVVPSLSATAAPTPSAAPLSARFNARPGDRLTIVRPGVFHINRVTADPLRVNILLFDLSAPEFALGVGLNDGWLSGRVRTSGLARDYAALAAVNGDLFSENGLPQGLTMLNGQVATAPKRRATFALSREGKPFIGYFTEEWTWQAEVRASTGAPFPITLLNQPCVSGQICLYNELARSVPARSGALSVRTNSRGEVLALVEDEGLRVRANERVLLGTGAGASWLSKYARLGQRLQINIGTEPPLSDYRQAISGGPIILRAGQFVQDCMCALGDCSLTARPAAKLRCEDFSTDWKEKHYHSVRMPRTGIGFDQARQTLIVAVVDGYQRGYSRGITQREFADLLQEFGASEAMELDGGGSSTMVLKGKVINRPPDASGERYVANALLFFWREQLTPLPSLRQ